VLASFWGYPASLVSHLRTLQGGRGGGVRFGARSSSAGFDVIVAQCVEEGGRGGRGGEVETTAGQKPSSIADARVVVAGSRSERRGGEEKRKRRGKGGGAAARGHRPQDSSAAACLTRRPPCCRRREAEGGGEKREGGKKGARCRCRSRRALRERSTSPRWRLKGEKGGEKREGRARIGRSSYYSNLSVSPFDQKVGRHFEREEKRRGRGRTTTSFGSRLDRPEKLDFFSYFYHSL